MPSKKHFKKLKRHEYIKHCDTYQRNENTLKRINQFVTLFRI